jgi:hypothetical protein
MALYIINTSRALLACCAAWSRQQTEKEFQKLSEEIKASVMQVPAPSPLDYTHLPASCPSPSLPKTHDYATHAHFQSHT